MSGFFDKTREDMQYIFKKGSTLSQSEKKHKLRAWATVIGIALVVVQLVFTVLTLLKLNKLDILPLKYIAAIDAVLVLVAIYDFLSQFTKTHIIGTGAREIGFMFGQYKRIRGTYEGVLTGKGLSYGGSLARTEATGYGLLYITEELKKCHGDSLEGKTIAVSGAGNVAIYAIQKAQQLGAKVVTCSDSTGWIYDPEGIDVELLREVKEVKRARLTEYAAARKSAEYHEKKNGEHGVWSVKCDIALPCATQNELDLEDAKQLVANGVKAVCEGANMPTTLEATEYFQNNGVMFICGKADNAGGVATSALEMSQNSERLSVNNLLETSDISTSYIVAFHTISLSSIIDVVVDINHNYNELIYEGCRLGAMLLS